MKKRLFLMNASLFLVVFTSLGQSSIDTLEIIKSGFCEGVNSEFYNTLDRGVKEIFVLDECKYRANKDKIIHLNFKHFNDSICGQKFDLVSYEKIYKNNSAKIYFTVSNLIVEKNSAECIISLIGKDHEMFGRALLDYDFCRMELKFVRKKNKWIIDSNETTCNE